jgi:hypothetical protein
VLRRALADLLEPLLLLRRHLFLLQLDQIGPCSTGLGGLDKKRGVLSIEGSAVAILEIKKRCII